MSKAKHQNKTVIVGATGLVGSAILSTLERFDIPVDDLVLLASERSAGKIIPFRGHEKTVKIFNPEAFNDARCVFFSGKDGLSEEFCPVAAGKGAWVIDNSAGFRMDPEVPLVVPEINIHTIGPDPGIIANPNCSTIQLAVALAPIRDRFGLKRVLVSTYQAASGAGGEYRDKLEKDSRTWLNEGEDKVADDSLAFNCIPAVGSLQEGDKFSEETKLENELKKILEMPDLRICATAVRVPTFMSHGESVVIETEKPVEPDEARRLLASGKGISLLDNPGGGSFPTPRLAAGTDPVWVGRIRRAGVFENDLAFWVVADNLLKGAALNAVQIASELYKWDL